MRNFLRSGAGRRAAPVGMAGPASLAAVAVVGTLLLAVGQAPPAAQVELTGVTAWLPSTRHGLVTLLDGTAGEAVASRKVAAPGSPLRAVQAGSSAFVIDEASGGVVRVDGATYDRTDSVRFSDGSPRRLQVFPSADALVVVDGERGTAVRADPVTLRPVEHAVPLAAQPDPGQAVMNQQGELVVVNPENGELLTVGSRNGLSGDRSVRDQGADPRARLLATREETLLVEPARGTVATVGGDVDQLSCRLETRAGEAVKWAVSRTSRRLYGAIPARGAVLVADLDAGRDCLRQVAVGRPGDDLGTPVETAGSLLVPLLSQGRVAAIDPARAEVTDTPAVDLTGAAWELTPTATAVFYNDPGSERAGVLLLEGGRWRAVPIRKYDPDNPDADIPRQRDRAGEKQQPQREQPPRVRDPLPPGPQSPSPGPLNSESASPQPSLSPGPVGSPSPGPSIRPTVADSGVRLRLATEGEGTLAVAPWPAVVEEGTLERCDSDGGPGCVFDYRPADGLPKTVQLRAEPAAGFEIAEWIGCPATPAAVTCDLPLAAPGTREVRVRFTAGLPVLRSLSITPGPVIRGQAATFTAEADNATGATWRWTITDPAAPGTVLHESLAAGSWTLTLPAGTPASLQVKVEVSTPAGAATPLTQSFTTTAGRTPQVSVVCPAAAEVGATVTCSGTDTGADADGTWSWTVAGPSGTSGPTGAAAGSGHAFTAAAAGSYTVTLSVTYDGVTDSRPATVTVSAPPEPIEPFLGAWKEVGTATYPRMTLERTSATGATLTYWAPCGGSTCPWGATSAPLSGGELRAFYDQEFVTRDIQITRSGDQLVVRIHSDFADPGRADYDTTETFRRE